MVFGGVPIANPVVVLREEPDGWAVLFNPDTADAIGINPTGVLVWQLMDGRRGLDDIVTAVRADLAGVSDQVEEEIRSFVTGLAKRGFVGYEVAAVSGEQLPAPTVPPLNQLYFYLTEGCNLACRHCWLAPRFETDGRRYPTLPVESLRDRPAPGQAARPLLGQADRRRAAPPPGDRPAARDRAPRAARADHRDQRRPLHARSLPPRSPARHDAPYR